MGEGARMAGEGLPFREKQALVQRGKSEKSRGESLPVWKQVKTLLLTPLFIKKPINRISSAFSDFYG